MVDYTYWKDLTSQTNEFSVLAQFNIITLLISYFVHPPKIFWYHYRFHCLPGSTVVSRETESEEDSYAFFFFGGEVGGEKGVSQWWIVEKKSHIARLKSVS